MTERQVPEPTPAVRAGTRLRCEVCGFELVVTKAGAEPALACHVRLVPPSEGRT